MDATDESPKGRNSCLALKTFSRKVCQRLQIFIYFQNSIASFRLLLVSISFHGPGCGGAGSSGNTPADSISGWNCSSSSGGDGGNSLAKATPVAPAEAAGVPACLINWSSCCDCLRISSSWQQLQRRLYRLPQTRPQQLLAAKLCYDC